MEQKLNSESEFYQTLRDKALGRIWFERVEPRTESGFPDTYFITEEVANFYDTNKNHRLEGTMELKFFKTKTPNLSRLMEPSQKAAFIEYDKQGGRRRFLLAARADGAMFFYCSRDVVRAITKGGDASASWDLFPTIAKDPEPIGMLIEMIRMFS